MAGRNKQRPRKPTYRVGDILYSLVHPPGQGHKESPEYFLCRCKIYRLPQHDSPVYKVQVISVLPCSLFGHMLVEVAKNLLQLKIARAEQQLFTNLDSPFLKVPLREVAQHSMTGDKGWLA